MRAQAHTLEGVAAALVVVVAVAFTLQATAVTPLTASTASQHIETQHERAASGLLAVERENGNISRTLRYWNASSASFRNATADGYYVGVPPNASFLRAVEETFGDRSVAYNVNAYYVDEDGDRRLRRVVYHGQPSSEAVSATRLVTLYDDQHVTVRDGSEFVRAESEPTLEDASYFPPDAPGHGYAVVEVEVVVWRM
ncbi:DUF7288 family protein [Halobacterium yunchengense]|uniref:DUF7288 family protein n=1 Tax=Halobacterium yunchengense TaxID=3108497 RepID=UPI0030082542